MQYLDKNVEQIRAELKEIKPIIEGTEFAMDYGDCPTKEEYEKYEEAIARRAKLTMMLGDDAPAPEMTIQ